MPYQSSEHNPTILRERKQFPPLERLPVTGPKGIFDTALVNTLLKEDDVIAALPKNVSGITPAEVVRDVMKYTSGLRVLKIEDPEILLTMLHPRNSRLVGFGTFGRVYRLAGTDLALKLGVYNPFSFEGKAIGDDIFHRHWMGLQEVTKRVVISIKNPLLTLSGVVARPFMNEVVFGLLNGTRHNQDYIRPYVNGTVTQVWMMMDEICGAFAQGDENPQIITPRPRVIFTNSADIPFCFAMDYIPRTRLSGMMSKEQAALEHTEARRLGIKQYLDNKENVYFAESPSGEVKLCAVDTQWGILRNLSHPHWRS